MKNSRRDTPIHHAPYMRSNHKLLFKGSNDFQGKITLPSSKEGQPPIKGSYNFQFQGRVKPSILSPSFHPTIYKR
jgi:hypothetical protein